MLRRCCALAWCVWIGVVAGCSRSSSPPTDRQGQLAPSAMPATEMIGGVLRAEPETLTHEGQGPGQGGDKFDRIDENPFLAVADRPRSTFSLDVDTASYAKTRMFLLQQQRLPPPDSVRIEDFLNYFDYEYTPPTGSTPFAVQVDVTAAPWNQQHALARIAVKGREIEKQRPASNLVLLLDVSGSMNVPNKLPLLIRGMQLLASQLSENDRVAIVVYAGAAGLVLPSTPGNERGEILAALNNLSAGGSTNGGQGIQLAYRIAREHLIPGGVNRVLLCTDGDFNVGTTSTGDLVRVAEEQAKSGVFLTILGFGMGNHNDALLEQLSNRANGNYAFIDSDAEARKVLGEQLSGTLVTIAKDVKVQVEFNPAEVSAYRLIGYENRRLENRDFHDDRKDAGEIGAGHTVTALYELVPAGACSDPEAGAPDPLRYQDVQPRPIAGESARAEWMTVKLRYKPVDQDSSQLLEFPVSRVQQAFAETADDFRFVAAVAEFAMLLRRSDHRGAASFGEVLEIASSAQGSDRHGYRAEFLELVRQAQRLEQNAPTREESRNHG